MIGFRDDGLESLRWRIRMMSEHELLRAIGGVAILW
jgi:hypothetical protein